MYKKYFCWEEIFVKKKHCVVVKWIKVWENNKLESKNYEFSKKFNVHLIFLTEKKLLINSCKTFYENTGDKNCKHSSARNIVVTEK